MQSLIEELLHVFAEGERLVVGMVASVGIGPGFESGEGSGCIIGFDGSNQILTGLLPSVLAHHQAHQDTDKEQRCQEECTTLLHGSGSSTGLTNCSEGVS